MKKKRVRRDFENTTYKEGREEQSHVSQEMAARYRREGKSSSVCDDSNSCQIAGKELSNT